MRYLIRTGTLPNLPGSDGVDLYNYAFQSYFDAGKKAQLETLDNFVFSMAFQPCPHQLSGASVQNTNGVNLLGLDPDHGDKVIFEYDVSWLSAATDVSPVFLCHKSGFVWMLMFVSRPKRRSTSPT